MALLFLILLALWGILMIAKPDLLWSIEHKGEMGRQEPTEKYVRKMRGGGIICIGVALFLMGCYFWG